MGADNESPPPAAPCMILDASTPLDDRTAFSLKNWKALYFVVALIYALAWAFAIAVDRHLYLDAAFHLFRIETESGFLSFWGSFSHEFFRTRAFAIWMSQAPAVFASDVLGISGTTLSMIYGTGLIGAKLVPLVMLWLLTRPEARAYLLLPFGALWVGTASADLVIISEGHVASTLVWIPAFYVLGLLRSGAGSSILAFTAAIALLLAYESMSVLGFIVVAASVLSLLYPSIQRCETPINRIVIGIIALLGATASAMSVASILIPRDVVNRDGLISSSKAVLDGFTSGYLPAISIVVPILFAFLFAVSFILDRLPIQSRWKVLICLAMTVLGVSATLAHVSDFPLGLAASGAYTERLFSLLIVPAVFLAMLVGLRLLETHWHWKNWALSILRALPMSVAAAALVQVAISFWMTTAWIKDTAQLELGLSQNVGDVSCRDLFAAIRSDSDSAGSMVCSWSVTPLSILLYGRGSQAIAVDPLATFRPIDTSSNEFRKIIAPVFELGARYSAKDLSNSYPYIFTLKGWNSPPIIDGFSAWPEPHGTWTNGKLARINVCSSNYSSTQGQLLLRFMAFLNEEHSKQRLTFALGDRDPVDYIATFAQGPSTAHVVNLPVVPTPGRCEILTIHLPDAISPNSLNLGSSDPRLLGIALMSISRSP